VGWEKVACWSTKVAVSLKHVKIEEKLLWGAYRNSPTLFRTVPSPTPCSLLFPKIGGLQPPPKTPIAIISGTGKATKFKFGRNIQKGVCAYPGTAQIFWVPPIISGTGKTTDFKFSQYIHRVHPNKSPFKILEKREHGHNQGLPNFLGNPY